MYRTRTALWLLGLGLLTAPAALACGRLSSPTSQADPAAREARHKAVARRWTEELWGRGDLAVADEIVAPDYVRHDGGDPHQPSRTL